jgi:hypothetical protein
MQDLFRQGELERSGLIERGRRQVTIFNRRGLAKASCECYQLIRKRIALNLPKTYTTNCETVIYITDDTPCLAHNQKTGISALKNRRIA